MGDLPGSAGLVDLGFAARRRCRRSRPDFVGRESMSGLVGLPRRVHCGCDRDRCPVPGVGPGSDGSSDEYPAHRCDERNRWPGQVFDRSTDRAQGVDQHLDRGSGDRPGRDGRCHGDPQRGGRHATAGPDPLPAHRNRGERAGQRTPPVNNREHQPQADRQRRSPGSPADTGRVGIAETAAPHHPDPRRRVLVAGARAGAPGTLGALLVDASAARSAIWGLRDRRPRSGAKH